MDSDSSIPDSINPIDCSSEQLPSILQLRQIELEFKLIELQVQNEHLRSLQSHYEESNSYYLDLFDNAPVGYLTLTQEGLIVDVNLTATKLLDVEHKDLLSGRFARFIAPNDADRWYLLFAQLITHNQTLDVELAFKNSQGEILPVQLNCISNNATVRIAITPIRQAKTVLQDAEATVTINASHLQSLKKQEYFLNRLQNTINFVPGVIYEYLLRPDGTSCFPYASAALFDIYRLRPDEVSQDASKAQTLIHPEDYEGFIASRHASNQDMTHWHYEYRIKFDDGTVRWLLSKALPQREADGSMLWHGFTTDITDRKLLEEKQAVAQASVQYYTRSLLEASLDPLIMISLEGKISDVNRATERVTGLERKQLIGSDFANYFTHPEKACEVYQLVFETGFVTDYPLAIKHVSGKVTDMLYNASVYCDDQDYVLGVFAAARDLSGLQQTEDKLRISYLALKQISQGVIITSHDRKILWVNEAFTSMTGYNNLDVVGLNPNFVHGPLTDPNTLKAIRLALEKNSPFTGEILNYRKDGSPFWNELTISPVFDAQGQLTNFVSATRDITERKQIEQSLRESEFLLKFAIEGVGDGVWDWNSQTDQVDYSRLWKEMIGYSEDEIQPIQQEWLDRIHPDDQLPVAEALQAYIDGKTAIYLVEYRLRCKDESYKWILSRGLAVDYNDESTPLRMIGTHTDISSIKKTQDSLLEKERMLSESQHIGHIGSWSLELATGLLTWSDEMYLIFGVTPEMFDHTMVAFGNLIHLEDLDLKNTWFNNSLKGEDMRELIFRIQLPDGSIRFICSTGKVQYDTLKKPLRFVGYSQDISARKYQEQQDKAHLNQLAHVTRLGLMGEMASGIAHEVNQPLTAIATYAQVSLNLIKAESPNMEKLAEVAYKTQQQALRAGQIISRMREFVKSNTRQVATTDLNELINDAVGLCLPDLKRSNITLTLQLQNPLPLINVDRIQIEQVIINLIRNSADAFDNCPDNQAYEISIHSLLKLNEKGIEVKIKDNGSGIP
ncbi:MAG: PAS domain S-box protein [Methylococcaceae bacterium]